MPAVNDTYSVVAGETLTVGSSEPYDLGVRPSGFDTVSWATEPTITSTVTVTNTSELLASIAAGSGRRTIVAAGTYNNVQINYTSHSDCWLDIQPGAVINQDQGTGWYGIQINNANRIKITGSDRQGSLNCSYQFASSNDVMIDGVSIVPPNYGSGTSELQNNIDSCARVSMINNYIEGNLFVWYGYGNDQWIGANNQVVAKSPQGSYRAPVRVGDNTNSIFADNNFVSQHAVDHMIRCEAGQTNLWWARNQGECTLGGQGVEQSTVVPGPSISNNTNIIWEDNAWYDPNGSHFLYLQEGGATSQHIGMTMSGERFYSGSNSPGTAIYANLHDWSITDSIYQAYTTPPAWSF